MSHPTQATWFPLFEFQDWHYQSYLALPQPADDDALAGSAVNARKWSAGAFSCGQAFRSDDGYTLQGTLVFRPQFELSISARGILGTGESPAGFEATATGVQGDLKGMVSELVGWVVPELPVANGAARVLRIQGAIRAVRGTDAKPDVDPSGMPMGSVGSFVIARVQQRAA